MQTAVRENPKFWDYFSTFSTILIKLNPRGGGRPFATRAQLVNYAVFKLQMKWKLIQLNSVYWLTHSSVRIMLLYFIRSLSPGSGLVTILGFRQLMSGELTLTPWDPKPRLPFNHESTIFNNYKFKLRGALLHKKTLY